MAFLLSALNNKSILSGRYYNGVGAERSSGASVRVDDMEVWGLRRTCEWFGVHVCLLFIYGNQPRKTPKRQPNMRLCSGKLRKFHKECEKHGHIPSHAQIPAIIMLSLSGLSGISEGARDDKQEVYNKSL